MEQVRAAISEDHLQKTAQLEKVRILRQGLENQGLLP